jgi:tetratricopeptide (TPR) repeat protein
MTTVPVLQRCPKCSAPASPGQSECDSCGAAFLRLCYCGQTVTIFDEGCPACGRSVFRKTTREYGGAYDRFVRAPMTRLTAGIRAVSGAPRAMLGRTRAQKHTGLTGRLSCRECGVAFEGRPSACPSCGATFERPCRCGATMHKVLDAKCPVCGHPARGGWTVPWRGLLVLALLAGVGVVAVRYWPSPDRTEVLEKQYRLGMDELKAGNPAEAVVALSAYLEGDPANAVARYLFGTALFQAGESRRGTGEVTRALELDPGMDDALVFLAERAIDDGETSRALEFLERSVAEEPRPARAYLLIGRIRHRRGEPARAIEALSKAVSANLEPPPVEDALLLGDLLRKRAEVLGLNRDWQRCRGAYQRVLTWLSPSGRDPTDARANADLARAYFGQGEDRRALYHSHRAAGLAGGALKVEMFLLQARAHARQENLVGAEQLIRDALTLDPSSGNFMAAATALREFGEEDRALEVLHDAVVRYPEDVEVLIAWARQSFRTGRGTEALDDLARLAPAFREAPELTLARAGMLRESGRPGEAVLLLVSALDQAPGKRGFGLELLAARIDALGAAGTGSAEEWRALTAQAHERLARDPDQPRLLLLDGKTQIYRGCTLLALETIREAVEEDPGLLESRLALGLALKSRGDFASGAEQIGRALAGEGAPWPEFRRAHAECEIGLRRFDRALSILDELLARVPEDALARILRAKTRIGLGRFEKAREDLAAARDVLPRSVEALCLLGYVELRSGRPDEARAAFEEAVSGITDPVFLLEVKRAEEEARRLTSNPQRAVAVLAGVAARCAGLPREGGDEGAVEPAAEDPVGAALDDLARFFAEEDLPAVERRLEELLGFRPGTPGGGPILTVGLLRLSDLAGPTPALIARLRTDATDTGALRALALRSLRRGDPMGAASFLTGAVSVSSPPVLDRFLLGIAAARMGDPACTLEQGRVLRGFAADPLFGLQLMVTGWIAEGEAKEALEVVESVAAEHPGSAPMQVLLARVLLARGRRAEARKACERALALDADCVPALWVLVETFLGPPKGWGEAREAISLLYEQNPESPDLNYLLGWLHAEEGSEAGSAYLKAVLHLNPRHRDAALLLGRVTEGTPQAAEGLRELGRMWKRIPGDLELGFTRAQAYARAGARDEAEAAFREVLRVAPRHDPSLHGLAELLLGREGKTAQARELLELALEIRPDFPVYLDTLGRLDLLRRDFRSARRAFAAALVGFKSARTGGSAGSFDTPRGHFSREADGRLERLQKRTRATLDMVEKTIEGGG